ncbi:hypothetical protein MCOR25_009965 [Pyricularia grisea]|uniref:Uncharacterized protein n=1 Tax=Pyricularia grisea TaxID=148305 RepID=A0A6P8B1Q9_PYRGI|nr:uncharacterized protein PgNI_07401 [Pyricularia grisea]KAI6351391.1 hypothetical protein MCOR25_009965 [Pyricularia grisea]TLD08781.1 hypothetical protein PgNI_07401 [Pyricularia grisea]
MQVSRFFAILALAISVTAIPVSIGGSKAVAPGPACHLDKAGRCQCHSAGRSSNHRLTARSDCWTDSDKGSDVSSASSKGSSPSPTAYNCTVCGKKSDDCREGLCGNM